MKAVKILTLVAAMLLAADCAFSQTWTQTSAPNTNWQAVASSADGTILVGAAVASYSSNIYASKSGPIYISTNSGANWTQSSVISDVWFTVACSADGTKMAATASFDGIYISTNLGSTWFLAALPTHQFSWSSVAFSTDGAKLIAVGDNASGEGIYISTNSGINWSQTSAPTNYWSSAASSADGCKLVAAGDGIYTSTNSGLTWIQTSASPVYWSSVVSSADGIKLAAVSNSHQNGIIISTNSGADWMPALPFEPAGIVSSADGNKLAAALNSKILSITNGQVIDYSQVYYSSDSGATWETMVAPAGDNVSFNITASSADGNMLVAIANGNIYTWQAIPAPQLNLAISDTNLDLSWTIPSTDFVLQQSADLVSWADVTNPPVLNLTNLQNQVMLPPSNSSGFFRLKTP